MRPKTGHVYEFGDFRLDPGEKILLRESHRVSLTPKVFDTLVALVENAGHLVEKEVLIQKVWQESFVEEGNLTFNIKMLRKALDDDANHPRFIETVPKRGYRFIAAVKEVVSEPRVVNGPEIAAPVPRHPARQVRVVLLIAILLSSSIVLGSWFWRDSFYHNGLNTPLLSHPFHSEKLSSSGKVRYAALSPDGRLAAFVSEIDGKFGVWLRRLETFENVQLLPPTDNVYIGLSFAPDGQNIFFVRTTIGAQEPGGVYSISILGGLPKQILERTEGWISFSPDGREISFVRCEYKDDDFCSLFVADIDGRNERRMITRGRPIRIGDNQFSPDGKSIVFASGQSWSGESDFRLNRVDVSSGMESVISTRNFFNIKSLRWLPDSAGLLITAMENLDGNSRIWYVPISSGEPQALSQDAASYTEISLDKNADRMIAVQESNSFQLFVSTGGSTKTLTSAREAVFTPGGQIVYSASDNEIWTINREGGEQRQLTQNAFKNFSSRVSSDGRTVYFTSNRTGSNQVWRMNIDGSDQKQLTRTEGGYPVYVSLDDKWVYYESGLHQSLWRVSTSGVEQNEVLGTKLFRPAFSPDGNLVAYFFRDKQADNCRKIAVVRVADKAVLKIINLAEEHADPVKIDWSPDNLTVNYVTHSGGKNSLWSQALASATPQLVADLGNMEVEDFSIAPDGNSIAYTRGEWIHDAVLILGLK